MLTAMPANPELLAAIGKFGPHDHLCSIYETQQEQFAVAIPFIRIGLERGEKCIYIADDHNVADVAAALRADGIDIQACLASGALELITKSQAYMKRGHFDPDWMFTFWAEAAEKAVQSGFSALRATGETEWVMRGGPGLERWMEYESRLTRTLAGANAFALCQYNRSVCPPDVILNVIRTHPVVIYGETVCQNFYFVPPEEFLSTRQTAREVERLLTNIHDRARVEIELRRAYEDLEHRVEERTAELARANRDLQAEIAGRLQAQNERDRFFMVSRDLFVISDGDGRITTVNPAWTDILGYAAAEVVGRLSGDLQHPDDREASARERQRILAAGAATSMQSRYRAKDGSYRWILWSAAAVPDQQRIYSAGRDITGLKQAEEALREREERFRKLFEEAPIGIALVALDRKIIRGNRALAAMHGCLEADLAGRALEELTVPEDRQRAVEEFDRLLAGAAPSLRIEKRNLHQDGTTIWVDSTMMLIRSEQGAPLYALGMIEDITGRKHGDEEVRLLNRQLEDRVAELTALNKELQAFTYSVSHDLRTPLRHIDGFSQLLLDDMGAQLPETALVHIKRVRGAVLDMNRMVDDLLKLAHAGQRELKRELTGMRSLVDEVLEELRPDTEGRDIRFEIGELPFADCDPAMMKLVFANLLANAVKFTRPRRPAVISVGQLVRDGVPAIFVRDNGVGFSMKYADRLFGIFQRLHRREDFEGTGVGLATVQRIIHKHGGRVWAEGELNKGATFYFTWSGRQHTPAEELRAAAV